MRENVTFFAIVLFFLSFVYAADLKETAATPQALPVPPDYLTKAAASYHDGLLQIEIPFSGNVEMGNYLGFQVLGVQWQTPKVGNPLGWISYHSETGERLYSGPVVAFSGMWFWLHDFMPSRVENADPALTPIIRSGGNIEGLREVFGDTYPNGIMRIVIYGELFKLTPNTPVTVRINVAGASNYATIPVPLPHQQFVNYIAFGGFADLIVNQEIVATNLGRGMCRLHIDLIDRNGDNPVGLHLDVPGESTVRAPLIDLYQEQTQSSELPSLQLGTALVTAITDGNDFDDSCEFTLGTVYQILQSDSPLSVEGYREAQSTTFLSEGGLAVPEPSCYNILPVRKSSAGEDTGIALANPHQQYASSVKMRLLDHEQNEVASVEDLTIGSLVGDSKFFWEFFDGLTGLEDFQGSLIIQSDIALGVIAMNTLNGYVQSSLPSGISEP